MAEEEKEAPKEAAKEAAEEREKATKKEEKTAKGGIREFLTKERAIPGVSPVAAAGTLKSVSFLIIALGLLQYFLRVTFSGVSTVTFSLSLLLFILAGYALATKTEKDKVAIFLPMLLFVLWYFGFGGNFAPQFLFTFLPLAAAILILLAVLTKGESAKPELYGFFPVLFLFLDIGLIPWLIENFQLPVTPLLDNLVLYMPWWTLFGIIVLPELENSTWNFLAGILRIGGIVYIVVVLGVSAIPDLGYNTSLALPEAGELEAAQARVRERLPQGENPFISNLACILSTPADVSGCVEQRQLVSSLETICRNRNLKEGTSEFVTCLSAEQEKQKQAALQASGAIDRSFAEVTNAEFVIVERFFPKETIRLPNQELSVAYPATLKISNPRKQEIEVAVSCSFVKGSTIITGEINLQGESKNTITTSDENNEFPLTCTSPGNLEGKQRLSFEAKLSNLKTTSSLKRVFLGEKSEQERQEIIERIGRVIFPSRTDALSKAPDEFARLNFDFGKTANDPYIAATDSIILFSSIDNLGEGKIERIKSYQIKLLERGFTLKSGDHRCLEGDDVPYQETLYSQGTYVLPYSGCFLYLPPRLKSFDEPFQSETFFADLVYDYKIRKEMPIEIKVEK